MKNPNSLISRIKRNLLARWSSEEYPGATPTFQIGLLSKDVGIFICLPLLTTIIFKSFESASRGPRRNTPPPTIRDRTLLEQSKSQIIEFKNRATSSASGFTRRSPGSLVKLKLLNVVETYSTAPVHAQIMDAGLGRMLMGGTLIGDATPDTTFERITINFRFARDPNRDAVALSIAARALSLDGTLGLVATKKEGFVTRSVLGSAGAVQQDAQSKSDMTDFKDILVKALTAGLVQEFGSETQVERNRAQVLRIQPGTEFFAELTDFFPGNTK